MAKSTARHRRAVVFPLDNDVLTVEEAAAHMKVSKSYIYKNLHLIPHKRIGGNIRFYKPTVDAWLSEGSVVPVVDQKVDVRSRVDEMLA
ncbi:MAG: excisionase family DNA-binding protein [Bacteroidota bacterium]